jgi:hypothetical protein
MAIQAVECLAHAIAGQVLADLDGETVMLEFIGDAPRVVDRLLQRRIGVGIFGIANDKGKPVSGAGSRNENRGEQKRQQRQQ